MTLGGPLAQAWAMLSVLITEVATYSNLALFPVHIFTPNICHQYVKVATETDFISHGS